MEGEKYITVSSLIPFFNAIIDQIEGFLEQSICSELREACENARSKIITYYSKTNTYMMMLSVMDPRFNISYLYDEEFNTDDIRKTKDRLKYLYVQYSRVYGDYST